MVLPDHARKLRANPRSKGNTGIDPQPEETHMNWDRIEGNWKQMKGTLKEKWCKLTDDEFDQIGGKRDQLVGKIQEKYGITRDEADKQVRGWEDSYTDQPRH